MEEYYPPQPSTTPVATQPEQPTVILSQNQVVSVPEQIEEEPETGSDWKFYLIVALCALAALVIGGSFLLRGSGFQTPTALFFSQQETDGALTTLTPQELSEATGTGAPAVISPEGDPQLAIATLQEPPKIVAEHSSFTKSFSLTYTKKIQYYSLNCSPATPGREQETEEKRVFYDPRIVTDNESLYALCRPDTTTLFAKIAYTQNTVECLGLSSQLTVADTAATECKGRTTSVSSTDTSRSLMIPFKGKTILVESNDPDYHQLIDDTIESLKF